VSGPAWFSQPFPPEGASAADGIRNQLGRPELDLLTILVRESAQNSWDARLDDRSSPIDYRIDLRTVGPAHTAVWRDLFQRDAPHNDHLPLRGSLRRPTIQVLVISDSGTKGLGGPTRADTAVAVDHDFVSFVRNIGEPRDTELGGGTYGFGKGIFYLISRPGTILLHTRCPVEGGYETRLIGCALWKSYIANDDTGERRYTGRHWWGDTSGEVVEPLIGTAADAMAHRLGLSPFGPEETGTRVIVIDPLLEDLAPARAADYLADTVSWHLWPKMLGTPSGGPPPMRFSVSCEGIDHPVPDPHETRPLDMFVAAYRRAQGSEGTALECGRPKKFLGRLGLEKRIVSPLEPTSAGRMVGIETTVHHVCLLRGPELVVTYHVGPQPASEHISYAGVFRAEDALDDTYALAEPPTHDAWHPQSLEYPQSTFVRTTFLRIKEAIDGLLDLGGGTRGGSAQIALGAASTLFSPLVGGAWGIGGATDYGKPGEVRASPNPIPIPAPGAATGAHPYPPESSNGQPAAGSAGSAGADANIPPGLTTTPRTAARRPRVDYVGDPYVDVRAGAVVIVQQFRLPVFGIQRVHADLAVALAGIGGRETDPPLGAEIPRIVGWEDASGTLYAQSAHLIQGGDDAVWRAIVCPARDTMTEITIVTQETEVTA
jgi:hypothetical protein